MSSATKGLIAAQVFLFAILNNATAQFQQSGYEVGINVGTLVYQGELTPRFYGYTKSLKPAIGLYADKSVSSYFTLRGNLVFGKVIADESKYASPEWRQYRGLKFATNVTELTATLVFNPFGEGNEFNYRRLNPYVFAGAGIAFLKVKRDWSDYNTNYFDAKSTTSIALGADTVHALP